MTEQQKIDLAAEGLLAAPPAAAEEGKNEAPTADASELDLVAFIEDTFKGLNDSVASFHIGLKMMNTRLAQVEKYVSYLLEKDPTMGPKMAELVKKTEAMEAAAAEAAKAVTTAGQ